MVFIPTDNVVFPDYSLADNDGLLAIGGNLLPKTLINAYKLGIFPWFNEHEPICWHAPDPRFVLFPEKIKISKSMRKVLQSNDFSFTENTNFEAVISHCSKANRKDQTGTWISQEMIDAYIRLHQLGYAKSIEVWKDNQLVGGFYGIELDNVFCGESMFALESNASKFGFISFVQKHKEKYKIIDCQSYTAHLESLGAEYISRKLFLSYLK